MKVSTSHLDITSIKCKNSDTTFANFTKCFHKRISRWISETTINITFAREIHKIIGKIGLYKLSNNKYNQYLFKENTFDGCKFLLKRSSYPMVDYLYKQIEKYTNLNRTCPLKDNVIMNRMRIDMEKLKWLPLANGDYSVFTRWLVAGKERFAVDFYFAFREEKN
ncbi:hypothetical protein CVS40_10992 [Lucilia cuprina]|nr:hypothetical protein CVS40_10992 [Lucilia cuprina]